MNTPERKSFRALMVTQFFSAFNDNVLKTLVQLLIVEWVVSVHLRNALVDLSAAVFVAPFLLFSMIAGRLSDRIPKPKVIVGVQVWQVLVVSVATFSLLAKSIPAMMLSLFLLSMQAAFFSPPKYGVLPELMGENELSDANGLLNMATFVAILIGTIVGTFLSSYLKIACALLMGASLCALAASLFMNPLPSAKPDEPLPWNPARAALLIGSLLVIGWLQMMPHARHLGWTRWALAGAALLALGIAVLDNAPDLLENWKIIRQDRALKLGIIAVNYFWFVGAILQLCVFLYAREMMAGTPVPTAPLLRLDHWMGHTAFIAFMLLIMVAIGIGLGSYLAGVFSAGKVEVGLVPLGALGMSLFAIDLGWAYHSLARTMADMFMLGMSGGFYEVPLNSLVQWRSPPQERGRVLAMQNFLSFVAILGASVALWLLGSKLNLNPAQVLLTLGVLSLAGTAVVYSVLPDAVWRFVLYGLTHLIYRIRIVGGENVPSKGPALLVSNHLSLADGFLVGASVPRLVNFLIWRPYYEKKPWHYLFRTMKAIPISDSDSGKEILRSLMAARRALQEGRLVCLFAEGQISRTGNLLEFKRGFEVIVKDLDVPVIPVHLDRVWGSIFSFEHGKVIFKRPRQIPYPVTVTFGQPVPAPVRAAQVRQAVMDLGADAFALRLEKTSSLALEFLKKAKTRPRSLAVADSSGLKMSYGRLAAVSSALADHLEALTASGAGGARGECVGLLLPPSVGAAVANIALSLLGRVPVNLNYTAGSKVLDLALEKAHIRRILTSRRLLEKTGLPATSSMVYLEDLVARLSKGRVLWKRVLFSLLPTSAVLQTFGRRAARDNQSLATILFSSGSTGIPKGVMLTHANILANLQSLAQVFDVGRTDRMIGVLPFFHSFGLTATLWFPLISGFSAIYHVNPLDAKIVGELAGQYKATLLLATPTFLLAYTRKCTPEQFRRLRYVIVGAEHLRESIARAFEEKFGITPLEGYGCTELSPVATVNVPDVSMGEVHQLGHKAGMIGQPLPGVSIRIVNPDTGEPLAQGEKGLLLVKGANVMKGYLGDPEKTREVIREGGWYVTGDIAVVDPAGFVRIVDRQSRFSKIGGEMVPHVGVEEKLQQLCGRAEPTFVVTAAPDEKRGEQLVVLYAGYEGSIDELYGRLQASDLPKLWIPARGSFFEIPALPYLGTGKLDLSALRALAREKTKAAG